MELHQRLPAEFDNLMETLIVAVWDTVAEADVVREDSDGARAFEGDTRHGAHLPDFGTPNVPNVLLDRLIPSMMRTNGENAAPKMVEVRYPTSSGDSDQAVRHV